MKLKILDINENDAYYEDREELIGKILIPKFTHRWSTNENWAGTGTIENIEFVFHSIKVEEVKE